jgi:hypothetical protein
VEGSPPLVADPKLEGLAAEAGRNVSGEAAAVLRAALAAEAEDGQAEQAEQAEQQEGGQRRTMAARAEENYI